MQHTTLLYTWVKQTPYHSVFKNTLHCQDVPWQLSSLGPTLHQSTNVLNGTLCLTKSPARTSVTTLAVLILQMHVYKTSIPSKNLIPSHVHSRSEIFPSLVNGDISFQLFSPKPCLVLDSPPLTHPARSALKL